MEIDESQGGLIRGHPGAVLDGVLVDAFARGENATAEVNNRADLQHAQVLRARRQIEVNRFQLRHCPIPRPPQQPRSIQRSSGACSP